MATPKWAAWARRHWLTLVIIVGLYALWRFTIAPAPFTWGQRAISAGNPWAVTLTGAPGGGWYGGCTAITATAASSPASPVSLPWTAHYPATVQRLECSFNSDSSVPSNALMQIRYQGHVVIQSRATGANGIVSASASAP